jgi:hypothetical protein
VLNAAIWKGAILSYFLHSYWLAKIRYLQTCLFTQNIFVLFFKRKKNLRLTVVPNSLYVIYFHLFKKIELGGKIMEGMDMFFKNMADWGLHSGKFLHILVSFEKENIYTRITKKFFAPKKETKKRLFITAFKKMNHLLICIL